jgi:hypothetical protein
VDKQMLHRNEGEAVQVCVPLVTPAGALFSQDDKFLNFLLLLVLCIVPPLLLHCSLLKFVNAGWTPTSCSCLVSEVQ